MKKGYIPKDQRKTLLMLSDDIRTHSGVGCQAKNIIVNSAHRYNWINLGGAIKHPDANKGFDISDDINHESGLTDAYVRIIASEGYGNPEMLRNIIRQEKPEALVYFTAQSSLGKSFKTFFTIFSV